MNRNVLCVSLLVCLLALCSLPADAQQTLGAVDGTVTDNSGAVVQGATVKAHNVGTNLEQSSTSKNDGSFSIVDLPIGTYTVTIAKDGFKTEVYSEILVQGNRTATVNATLQPGAVTTQVTVTATPLLNQTDTTNGYTLSSDLIESIPLGTGSFTQLAVLAPGTSADFLSGSGSGSGLGNQSIWANGQRDTSNSFEFNGVNATNVFNGKSSSSLSANRIVLNTGESFNTGGGGDIATNTSVYGAIGEGLPTPPQETIEEINVTTSMYDASQGANAGAHIELTTKSGTNDYHGGLYEYHQTDAWDANEFFRNAAAEPRLNLKRNVFGGTLGGPVIKDKLFFFGSYQGQRVADGFAGSQQVAVPVTLTDDRSAAGLATAANTAFGTSLTAASIDPTALAIMNLKLANGNYVVPSAQITNSTQEEDLGYAAVVQGPSAKFNANQVNANVDYNFSKNDRIAAKYYYQHDPTNSPFPASPEAPSLLGFPTTLEAGSQVFSLVNTTILTPSLTWEQRFGFIREIAYSGNTQEFTPSDIGMTLPSGIVNFPSIKINKSDGHSGDNLYVGPASNFANAGVFQNQFEGETSLNWVHGRHTVKTGVNFIRNQLNVVNKNLDEGLVTFKNFADFLQGEVCGPSTFSCSGDSPSQILNGSSNRYYRTNQMGAYAQDDLRLRSNLSVTVGLRWDWDGPLVEKYGYLTSFYPQDYSYDVASDSFSDIGLVVAGDNKNFGTKGVSNSTMTGRQWGFAPRIGLVWSPSKLKNFVVRTGFGMYYDRGEFFTELSPAAGGGVSGPFGVTVEEPFVVPYYPTSSGTFSNPFGSSALPAPPQNLSGVSQLVPTAGQVINDTTTFCQNTGQVDCGGLYFGGYDPRNKLPYSENWTLDLQWQPYNSLVLDVAYVGNHGVHEVLPIPFNEAKIATPQNPALAANPANAQPYSYGYTFDCQFYFPCTTSDLQSAPLLLPAENVSTIVGGYGSGNIALRVPYIGFDPNSDFNEAEGISHYDALQLRVSKRMSHGLLVNAAYTYSHTLDEGSGLGLFYNGNDPLDPASAYATSDFDRTHVFTISYQYLLPSDKNLHGWSDKVVNGWGIGGLTVLQSGQPYSVYDYSGSAAGYYWNAQDFITNPIVPIGGLGSTATQAVLQGTTGVNAGKPVLNANAFGPVQPVDPNNNAVGVPACNAATGACDSYETLYSTNGRNLFRGPFQERFDFSVFKNFKINERFNLRFDAQFFNIFNHASFDTPNNDVTFNPDYDNPPAYGTNIPGVPYSDSYYSPCNPTTGAYACPGQGSLGFIQHTLGSPRFIQMALHLTF
jgi:hypothetical protein